MEVEKDIISQFIRKQFSLWLWDWGDCLINNSLYYGKTMSPEEISKKTDTELDNEIPSWRFFQKLIPYLTKYGIRVGIVSFSVQSIIKAYMDRIFGLNQHYFNSNNIRAPCEDNQKDVSAYYKNKNDFIVRIMKNYRLNNPNRVIFFDDDSVNITEAAILGIVAVKVGSCQDNLVMMLQNRNNLFSEQTIKNVEKAYNEFEDDVEKMNIALNSGQCNYRSQLNTFSAIGNRKVGIANLRNSIKEKKLWGKTYVFEEPDKIVKYNIENSKNDIIPVSNNNNNSSEDNDVSKNLVEDFTTTSCNCQNSNGSIKLLLMMLIIIIFVVMIFKYLQV